MNFSILISVFLISTTLFGAEKARIECQARVSKRSYAVELDVAEKFLKIKDDLGFFAEGNASYAFSQAEKTHRYLLGISLSSSVQIDIESEGKERIALCLGKNECYPCQ